MGGIFLVVRILQHQSGVWNGLGFSVPCRVVSYSMIQVMDPRTRMILFKLLNQGFFRKIDGCLSTGKEANVYYAVGAEVSIAFHTTSRKFAAILLIVSHVLYYNLPALSRIVIFLIDAQALRSNACRTVSARCM